MRTTGFSLAVFVVLFLSAVGTTLPHAAAAARYEVTGTVVSDQGVPLAGAQVNGYSYSDADKGDDSTTTDDAGRFVLSLPAGQGTVSVYYGKWRASDQQSVAIDGNVTGIAFTLRTPPPKTAIVEGRILDASGNPVSGATVRLDQACCYAYAEGAQTTATEPASPPSEGNASTGMTSDAKLIAPARPIWYGDYIEPVTTGDDGKYRFETYAGPRTVWASAKGYAQSSVAVTAEDNRTKTVDLTLEKVPAADAMVRGKVTDAKTGLPVQGAQVSLYNLEWGRSNWTTTGADGSFEFQTLPGWTQVNVYATAQPMPLAADATSIRAPDVQAPSKSYYQHASTLTLASGENPVTIKLEPKPEPTVVLVGYVVDPVAKTGVKGAYVNVWNQDAGEWGNAQTDATGSYKILVRPGHYTINAWAEGYLGGAATFVLGDDAKTARQDVEVQKGTTKYAPCDDCYGGPVMYDAVAKSDAGVATPAPSTAIASRESSNGATTSAAPQAAGSSTPTGTQAYSGTGGGLPAYSASESGTPTPTSGGGKVPFVAPALVLVALAALALVARRRS